VIQAVVRFALWNAPPRRSQTSLRPKPASTDVPRVESRSYSRRAKSLRCARTGASTWSGTSYPKSL